MAIKKNKLKYLSQSILLEEQGIPRINLWIIVIVFMMVVSFVSWSVVMQLDEVITVSGTIESVQSADGPYEFNALIPSNSIGAVRSGLLAVVNIPGIKTSEPLKAQIEQISESPMTNASGNVYYEARVVPEKNSTAFDKSKDQMRAGMKTSIQIVVGKRSLFEYFLGPVLQTKDNALKEK